MESFLKMDQKIEQKSGHDLAKEILKSISDRVGIDLFALVTADETPSAQVIEEFKRHIVTDAISQFRKHKNNDTKQDFGLDDVDDATLIEKAIKAEAEPNWMINPKDLAIVKSYRGEKILTHLKVLTKRFEQMTESSSPGMLAANLLAGGLVALGARAGYLTWKAWKGGAAIRAAAVTGIKGVGMGTVISIAAVALAMLVLWLIFMNQKNVLGLVINESDKDLIVKNYKKKGEEIFMNAGNMENFMEDQESLSAPIVQIKGGYTDEDDPTDSFYYGGVYFADKKAGFYGAEGLFVLTPKKGGKRIAVMFASPYSNNNGTNMKILSPSETNLKNVFKELYKDRKTNYNYQTGGTVLQSRINNSRGGNVGNIAFIKLPS